MTAIQVTFADGETLELVKLRAAIDSPVLKAPTFDEKERAAVRAALELAG